MRAVVCSLLFFVLWNCYWLADSIGIFISPESNQYIAINSNDNITYSCEVDGDRSVLWTIQGAQTSTSDEGVFIDTNFNSSVLTITKSARDEYRASATTVDNRDRISVQCSALQAGVRPQVDDGDVYFIVSYGVPDPPMVFQFLLSGPELTLDWLRPSNVPSVVDVNYSISITGPTNNTGPFFTTKTSFSIHFLEVERMNSSCERFVFDARATNDAGTGQLSRLTETIPISTNVSNISQSLAVESVNLNRSSGIQIQFSFLPVRSCSRNFPVMNYDVLVKNEQDEQLVELRLDFDSEFLISPPLDEKVFVTLNGTNVPGLRKNDIYRVSVNVCSEVTCRESEPLTIYATGVQNVKIYFFENNVFVECSFATNSLSRGCLVRLVLDGNETMVDELMLLRSSNSASMLSQCNTTANQRSAYNEIIALDLELNGTQGSIPIPVIEMEPILSAREYTDLTGCSTSGTNVVAIAVPIIVIVFVIVVIIGVVVFFATHYKQHRRIKKIKKTKQARLKRDKNDPHTYTLDIDHDTTDLICSDTPEVTRSASAPTVASMAVSSNGESTAELLPTNTERKKIKYVRSVSEGGENKSQTPPVEVVFDSDKIHFKVNRPALRSAARKRSRSRSDGSFLSSDSEESMSLIPPMSLEVKFSEELQKHITSTGQLSPLPEEVEESTEERNKTEDDVTNDAIVFEGHHEQETDDEQSNVVDNGHKSNDITTV